MKAMILVLSPEECEKLLNGDLSILVRKRFPKDYVGWVYIYVAKNRKKGLVHHIKCACNDYGWDEDFVEFEEIPVDEVWPGCELNGKVVARFWCDMVDIISATPELGYVRYDTDTTYGSKLRNWSCLTYNELHNYLKGNKGYAIHITKLEIFDKPKEISEFRHSHCDNLKNIKVVMNYIYDEYVFQYFDNERCRKCNHYDSDCNDCLKDFKPLTCAPRNGWCYVEV